MEVQAALSHGTRVIPLILDDGGEQELPPFLRVYQWVDFRPDYDNALRSLVAALQPFRGEQHIPDSKKKTKGYVFLSYAEEDAAFVEDLKGFLAKRGMRIGTIGKAIETTIRTYTLNWRALSPKRLQCCRFSLPTGSAREPPSRSITSRRR